MNALGALKDRDRWVAANAGTLGWLLARPPLAGGFLNTKQNSISLADYGPQDGLRGPGYLYGWIQGRGLESLAAHAGFFAAVDAALAARLDAAGQALYPALDALRGESGHAYFCYDSARRPIYADAAGVPHPQLQPRDIYTYSDAFVAKGLVAAAARHAPADLPRRLEYLAGVVGSIERNQFLMAEGGPLDEAALAAQPDDLGPRMILLGAAAMLVRLGLHEHAAFAERFIAHIIDGHLDPKSGLLRNVPGEDACNVGHGIEFVGFALEYLPAGADPGLVATLQRILLASFNAGYDSAGIHLTVSVATGKPISPYCPWWSLPEAVRAAALLYERTGSTTALWVCETASTTFFDRFWRGEPAIAYQTMTAEGAVDYVPATPDLDPGYHTGLSFLAAIEASDRLRERG